MPALNWHLFLTQKSPNMRFSASCLPTLALYLLPAVATHRGWGVVSAAAAVAVVCLVQFALTFASVAKYKNTPMIFSKT